jgi:hypothetical protein
VPKYVNEFAGPSFVQETIKKKHGGGTVGVIRIKPSSVLWKPSGEHQFYCVPLGSFTRWIMSRKARASRTGS